MVWRRHFLVLKLRRRQWRCLPILSWHAENGRLPPFGALQALQWSLQRRVVSNFLPTPSRKPTHIPIYAPSAHPLHHYNPHSFEMASQSPDAEEKAPRRVFQLFTGQQGIPFLFQQLEAITEDMVKQTPMRLLPRLEVGGQYKGQYVLEEWGDVSRPRTSLIKKFGYFLVQVTAGESDQGDTIWACKICDTAKKVSHFRVVATTGARKHLREQHKIHEEDPEVISLPRAQSVMTQLQVAGVKRAFHAKDEAEEYRQLILSCILDLNLSFRIIEKPQFRELLQRSTPAMVAQVIPRSHNTVAGWVDTEYHQWESGLKVALRAAQSRIHISFDLWQSPDTQSYISVESYFVCRRGLRRVRILAFERVIGSHAGENQAEYLIKIFKRFDILDASILGYFVGDNATSNDTCIRAILPKLYPSYSNQERKALEELYRLRCLGHIINLAAKAFIEGSDFLEFPDERDEARELRLLEEWRKKGPIGKLHNVCHFIRRSPKRKDRFEEFSKGTFNRSTCEAIVGPLLAEDFTGLNVIADNSTRWNSIFLMVV